MTTYGIICNCNYESSDNASDKLILRAAKAAEAGRVDSAELTEALDALEEALAEHADSGSERSVKLCQQAEDAVVAACEGLDL